MHERTHDGRAYRIRVIIDEFSRERLALNAARLHFSRPGKPTDITLIESFNGSFRDECRQVNWFLSLEDARAKIEQWRRDYNEFLPHSSPGNMAPGEFALDQRMLSPACQAGS